MKKFISLFLCILLALPFSLTAGAATTAKLSFDGGKYILADGGYALNDIKNAADSFDGSSSSLEKLSQKFGNQLIKTQLYASGVESLNDIYGIQGSVVASSENVVPLTFVTTLQNSERVDFSLWSSYLKRSDTEKSTAQLLLYGTMPLTSPTNKTVNRTSGGKYLIGTLYCLVANEQVEDFSIDFTVTDIASKDINGTVVSAAADFEKKTTAKLASSTAPTALTAEMLGAKIRTAGAQGLRFGTRVKKDDYFKNCENIVCGTLIVASDILDDDNLEIGMGGAVYDCPATVLQDDDDYLVFSGEIVGFPLDGSYDTVNFTARSYIKYTDIQSGKQCIHYADKIVRSVDGVREKLNKK